MTALYDFSVLNQDNQETPLDAYRGKVLLYSMKIKEQTRKLAASCT